MGVGVWVAVDPAGFQDIVAARAVLSAGAWLLLAVGIALSLLGFLGCCGALRRSRPLLLLVREGRWVGRGCRMWAGALGAGVTGWRVVGDAGVPGGARSWCSSSSTHPAIHSPPCGSQFGVQRIYKAIKWGQFSLKPLACPTWHFQDIPTAGEGQKHLFEHQHPHFFSIPSPLQTVLIFNPCLAATVVRNVASVPRSCTHIPHLEDAGHRQGWCRGGQG